MIKFLSIFSILLLIVSCNQHQQISLEILHRSSETWDGAKIKYPDGNEEITAVKIILAPNAKLPFHCHPYPTIGYVIDGKVEVEKANGIAKTFAKGDVVFELVNSWHRGRNPSKFKQTKIIAFYIGQKYAANTILQNIESLQSCS
jgi:quercetin dioxygenase-like cupin family protein